jgi:ribosomal protein L34E
MSDTVIQFPGRTPDYPRCPTCHHTWHGIRCITPVWRDNPGDQCGCPTSVETTGGDAA